MIEQLDRFVRKGCDLVTAKPNETALQAAERMAETNTGCLIVLDEIGRLAGVVTEKDLVHKVLAQSKNPGEVSVSDIMSTNVVTCEVDMPVYYAGELMARRGIRHLPITDKGRVVGMVSSRDIIAHEIAIVQKEAQKRFEALQQEQPQVL